MRRCVFPLFLVLMFVFGASMKESETKPKVFVIGDSISMQYGPYLEKFLDGFMDYDRKRNDGTGPTDLDNPSGANGGDSRMVLEYLRLILADPGFQPDILLLNCGLHDIKTHPETKEKQVDLEEYRTNLLDIYKMVNEKGVKLIWVRSTPVDDEQHNSRQRSFYRYAADLDGYNRVADQVFSDNGVPIIDLYGFTQNLGEGLFIDHVHFDEDTRSRQAAYIAGYLLGYKNVTE